MPALATRPTTCKPSRWPARLVQWPDQLTCFKGKTVMASMVPCIKLKREAEGLDYPPYPAALGVRIWQDISKEAWAQWMDTPTRIVNANRLNMADARSTKYSTQHK